MKQTKADLLIEIGKLTQLVEEIRDRLTRLEARSSYTPYRQWPYTPWYGSITPGMSKDEIKAQYASAPETYKEVFGLKPGKMEWEPDYKYPEGSVYKINQETGTVTEGRFRKDGSFEAELKA